MLKLHNHLSNAEPGIYIVYSQPAEETGFDGQALSYLGPFDDWQSAEDYDDGQCQREWVTEVVKD